MLPTEDHFPGSVRPVDPVPLQALLCRAGLAVAVLDGSGRLSMMSPGLERMLERPFADVPAESLAEVFHLYSEGGAHLLQPYEVPITRASRGEVVEDAIVTVRAPGQPVRHLRVNATPIQGPHGERQGAWAVMTDVTNLVAAARGELSRSLAETVNHNLRTPLTTVLGHAELLMDQQHHLPPETTRSLQAVWRAGQRLNEVVGWITEWMDLAYAPRQLDAPRASSLPTVAQRALERLVETRHARGSGSPVEDTYAFLVSRGYAEERSPGHWVPTLAGILATRSSAGSAAEEARVGELTSLGTWIETCVRGRADHIA